MVVYMRRTAFIVAALALLGVHGGVALAGAPANDDVANAVDVPSLPFTHSVDITEATPAPEDLQCGTLPGDHTVWYRFTPSSDARIGIHIDSEVQELSMSIFAGSPGSLIMLYCSYSYDNALDVHTGTTYYVQLATCCGAAGGPVTITMQEVQGLTTELRVVPSGQIGGTGLVEIRGRVRCDRQTPAGSQLVVQGTLTQGDTDGWLVPVHFSNGCSEHWMSWSTTVQLLSGSGFEAGKAALRATVFACGEFDTCAEPVTRSADVRLR